MAARDGGGLDRRPRQDHVRLEVEQFLDGHLQPVRRAEGGTELEAEVDAFDPAALPQAGDEVAQARACAVDHAASGQLVVERQCGE
ncbi:hypothetical protein ABH994_002584 [Bradyrhizobium yuanmingense]|uniref:hypothetical protein n=1 Tax=Bradyrhizobium yuanmingense TaxID=108015 RepID=UPI0035179C67